MYMFLLVFLCNEVRRSLSFSFFFQAEDGIRDLVRSRGLGDVYKRQALNGYENPIAIQLFERAPLDGGQDIASIPSKGESVSYTHLTLPTSDLV